MWRLCPAPDEDILMKISKSLFTLVLALGCAAFTFSLAVSVQAQVVEDLANFSAIDGWGPWAPVVQAADGNFYGTTFAGGPYGSYGYGVLFRVTPGGKLTDLYNFCSQSHCADGSYPTSTPVLGSDGYLYGVASGGGSGSGTIYRTTLDGELKTLYTFCSIAPCTDGTYPTGMILAGDGNFYGATNIGGTHKSGTIFSVTPAGEFKSLYNFCSIGSCLDGANPYAPPILGSDGNFYGVTAQGGSNGDGVLYELTPKGFYKVLFNFSMTSAGCGAQPFSIVQDAKGNFFGTTAYGTAAFSNGIVFEITSAGQCVNLHNFGINSEPVWPSTGLTIASDGNLYGVDGGAYNNAGLIFEVTSAGAYSTLYSFIHTDDGSLPVGPLFQATDGNFYSTTIYGPGSSNNGMVFLFSDHLGPLVETVPTAGAVGQRIIILGNGLTGSTRVTFNGKSASFAVISDTEIKATVPAGATSGVVSVVTPTGTLNSNPAFRVTK
jgi:uncharacterized repeat protein (TIGR03803 family)